MRIRISLFLTLLGLLSSSGLLAQHEAPPFHSEHQSQAQRYEGLGLETEADFDAYNGYKGAPAPERITTCALQRKVYGWYPYWMGSSYTSYDFTKLSTFSYFSYDVNPSTGNYSSIHSWRTTNSVNLAHAAGCRVELCATLFGASNNTTFLTNMTARQTFIDSIISLVQLRNADGVNIDFEGIAGSQRNNFTSFMQSLSLQLKAAVSGATLSMALYSVDWSNVFDIPALDPYVDDFVIMGYGYYYSGSTTAGPNAPLYSGSNWAPYNLTKSVLYYLGQGITPSKLLIGLPYYGNEYTTTSNAVPSSSTGFVSSRTYSYVRNNYDGVYTKTWDNHSFSPVYIFQNAGVWRQSWSEDVRSLAEKFDLVMHRNIGGIGIWALGYDDGYQDLWNLISQKFSDCGPEVCADTLYDTGGPMGNYANNENNQFTIASPNGQKVRADFIAFNIEANWDYMYIYDGPSTASPLIGQYTGTTIPPSALSTGSALTFKFTSDNATVRPGYELKWACEGSPAYGDTIRLDHNASANINCGINYHVFYDSDAGVGGTYLNDERNTMTFCAPDPDKSVRLTFDMLASPVQLDLISSTVGNDYLWVWDGPDTTANVKALYTGSTSAYPQPGTIISRGQCLTARLHSDATATATGFKATLRCVTRPTVNPTILASTASPQTFYDTGGAGAGYSNNQSYVTTYCPTAAALGAGEVIWAVFGAIGIEQNYDYLNVYDGNGTNARLIATYTGNATHQNDLQTIKATVANASGCLTFEFYSDGGVTASGWAATMRSGPARKNYGSNTCSTATLINAAGVSYAGSTTLATGKPAGEDPNLNIQLLSLPQCSGSNAITRLENTIWYKFSTPSTICPEGQIDMMLENISCQNSIPGGNGAQIAIYQVPTCQTGAGWGAPVYCADKMLASVPVNIAPLLQPSQTYYVMVDGFAGQHCNLDLILTGIINGCILPIELLSFEGMEMSGFVQLDWQTAAEQNNVGFYVERMLQGQSGQFEEIGFVAASPDSDGNGVYTFQDPNYGRQTVNYYRLRQLDADGRTHYHRVIEIRPGDLADLAAPMLYPNPFQTAVTVHFAQVGDAAGGVALYDLSGRKVYAVDWAAGQQPEDLVLDTEALAPGVYLYRIVVGGKVFAGKVVRGN